MTDDKWNSGPSMEKGFWSIVAQSGRVIALRVTEEKLAERICFEHNDYLHTLELLDAAGVWTGADDFASDRVAAVLIELKEYRKPKP